MPNKRETLHLKPHNQIEGSWVIGLTNLEVFSSIFDITEENNKIEHYTRPLDSEFSFTKLKDEVAKALGLSQISIGDLEHELYGPNINKTFRKLSTGKSQTDGFL